MSRRGRRTKLTPELQDKFCDLLRVPMSIEAAAGECDISVSVVMEWMQRGRGEHPRRKTREIYVQFAEAVEKARGKGEAALTVIVAKAAEKHWQAAMTMLERMHPDRWARAQRIKSDVNQVNVNLNSDVEPEDAVEHFRGLMAAQSDSGDSEPDNQ